jgi:T-complex protein 1 subunit alpha
VILAAELLKRANDLVKNKVHPTSIMAGYRMALKESVNFIQRSLIVRQNNLTDESILQAAKTSMSSKLLAAESDFFGTMVVSAM